MRNLVSMAFLVCLFVLGSGCQAPQFASKASAGNNDDIKGEKVEVNLITYCQWKDSPRYNGLEITLPDQPDLIAERADVDSFRRLDSVAGAVIGAAIDFIQARIKKEAAKHERQFHGTTYADDFWLSGGQPKYAAFEVIRTTDAHGESDPAYRLICAFYYSEHDPRLCLIKPVHLRVKAAKAKVSSQGGKRRISSKVNIFLTGAWVTDKVVLVQQDLANAAFTQSSYDLARTEPLKATFASGKWAGEPPSGPADRFAKQTYGYFRAPPLSPDRLQFATSNLNRAKSEFQQAEKELKEATKQYEETPDADDELKAAAKTAKDDAETARDCARIWRDALLERRNEALAGGAFQLSVLVTETDKSKTQEMLIKIADYVGSQKKVIIEAVTK